MKKLAYLFLLVDFSFIAYWLITGFHLIPQQWLFNDYTNPILVNWNWSFLPLDLLISFSGLYSLRLSRKRIKSWKIFALISLVLTSVSGLQAISYWTFANEFDPIWWFPNLFLLIYPLFFIPQLVHMITNNKHNEFI